MNLNRKKGQKKMCESFLDLIGVFFMYCTQQSPLFFFIKMIACVNELDSLFGPK